jgi:hypothetical protein
MAGASHSQGPDDFWIEVVLEILAGLWARRLELALVGLPLLADRLLARRIGETWAGVLVGLVVGLALAIGPIRRAIFKALHAQRVRRRWKAAAQAAGAVNEHGRTPQVHKVVPVAVGDRLLVSVPRGTSAQDLAKRAETLAAALAVRDVRIEREPTNAAFAWVTLVKRDPLGEPHPLAWPWQAAACTSLWRPIPVGVDENGQPVGVSLPERNILIGGEPGAGKSAALSQLIAAAALDPSVKLWLLDGKMVELAAWAPVAKRAAGIDPAEALELLRELRAEMDERYTVLLDRRLRKVTAADGLALHVVACDELAFYLTLPDRKQRSEFSELMRDLVSRGRAAGIIVLAATQKPSSEVIPTALRDLFGFRWAMRCNTAQASDTILGSGWATLGYNAAHIPGSSRGVGYLLSEGGQPQLIKSHYLDDHAIDEIAARAVQLRANHNPAEPR